MDVSQIPRVCKLLYNEQNTTGVHTARVNTMTSKMPEDLIGDNDLLKQRMSGCVARHPERRSVQMITWTWRTGDNLAVETCNSYANKQNQSSQGNDRTRHCLVTT